MSTLVAQHPWLTLSAVFLLGFTVKYLLDVFFLRQRLFDAEAAVERRGKDLDSERYAHGRTQAELKAKLVELDTAQKARSLTESLLAVLKTKHADTEATLTATTDQAAGLTQELAATQARLDDSQSEAYRQTESVADLSGRLTATETSLTAVKEWANALSVELTAAQGEIRQQTEGITSLTSRLTTSEAALAAAQERVDSLGSELTATQAQLEGSQSEARQRSAAAEDLALRLAAQEAELATANSALVELRANLTRVSAEAQAASQRIPHLEHDLDQQLAKAAALTSDLQVALRGQADAQSSAGEAQSALASTQSALTAARKAKAEFETALSHREDEVATAIKLAEEATSALTKSQHEADGLRAKIEKLELALADAKSDTGPLEQKLKARQDDVKLLTAQLGETTEELAALKERHAQTEANLLAATETRSTLEAEARTQDEEADALRTQLATQQERLAELESELKAVSEAHAALQAEADARPAVAAVVTAEPETNENSKFKIQNSELLAELEAMTRERNEFAAELATLRASLPAPAAKRSRKSEKPASTPELVAPPEAEKDPEEFTAACPQHLSDVPGIGPSYEPKLFAAGVGSYWELSQLSNANIAEVLELTDLEREVVDFDGIRHDAARLARETKSVGRKWSGAEPDDLKAIDGITPTFEKRLYDAGVCTFAALAAADPEKLAELCPGNAQRPPDHASWIALAKARTEGGEV